jgi:hypothetical protein
LDSSAIADADGDGVTDGADFLVWQRQAAFDPAPEAEQSVAVPEPTGAIAWGAAALVAARRRFGRAPVRPSTR